MSDHRIKRIITNLLAKARGTDNEAEASAFLAKAMDMLQQHQLDVIDLVDADDPVLRHVGMTAAESGHAWRWRLYSRVAQLYGCKSIHVGKAVPGKGGRLVPGYEQVLVGRESAIITADLMYPWIVSQVKAEAKKIAALTGMSEQGQAKRVAAALCTRISAMLAVQQGVTPSTDAGRNALVVMDQVTAKYAELFPDTQRMASRGATTDGLSRAAAEGIGLHRQAGGKSQLALS